jgi:transglutaminase-like putative cysteine protease
MNKTMKKYLDSSEHIDWQHPSIIEMAESITKESSSTIEIGQQCFEWVRDNIRHSADFKDNEITCKASDVLAAGTGYCYAKSHLLAALLRSKGIPTGLCYQRLSRDENGPPFCLHGLNAVYLPEIGWYRIDPRGNKPGVDAQFCPPTEKLAFAIQFPGEGNLPEILSEPLAEVVAVLQKHKTYSGVWKNLPDIEITKTFI